MRLRQGLALQVDTIADILRWGGIVSVSFQQRCNASSADCSTLLQDSCYLLLRISLKMSEQLEGAAASTKAVLPNRMAHSERSVLCMLVSALCRLSTVRSSCSAHVP